MLTKVAIKNFKSLRDVQIDLERFTVFVGPNASGKSSILRAIHLLSHAFEVDDRAVETSLADGRSRGSRAAVEVVAESGRRGVRYRPHPWGSHPEPDPLFGYDPQSDGPWDGYGRGVTADVEKAAWLRWPADEMVREPIPAAAVLRLEPAKLVEVSVSGDPTVMAPDGTGLHTALANMALNDPDRWQQLQADLKRIVPSVRRLRHSRPVAYNQPPALLFDTVGADSLPTDQVSEGTLLVLGLLTALHTSGRPGLMLLDDLDRGLHPNAQKQLISLLRALLDTNGDLQILATTHSPYMLDCMQPGEVRITFPREDGATVCSGLAQHPKFEQWKDEMTPGEMWSLFGEKWLVEGATA